MAAAVADYRPAEVARREDQEGRAGRHASPSSWSPTPTSSPASPPRKRDGQVVVGFAAETEPDPPALIELGRAKLARKGCDFLVLNQVGWTRGLRNGEQRGRGPATGAAI